MLHFIFLLSQTSLQLYLLSISLTTYYKHIYESIVHGDPNIHGGIADLNFTHTIISEDLITRMGVGNSFAYTTRNEINIEDEDEESTRQGRNSPRLLRILWDDIQLRRADLNFTHTRIPADLITRMGVGNSFAYTTRNEINIEDKDEDEYTPREKLSTVTADTLGRYSIETRRLSENS